MKKSAIDLLKLIQDYRLRVFLTGDLITLTGMTPTAITHALSRLDKDGLLTRIKRSVWINRLAVDFHPYEAVSYLRSPWPVYISLYSALADYGIIEEVPQVIYAVSAALPQNVPTPLGTFHFHHLPERLIWGYNLKKIGHGSYMIAEPEKAFLDLVYLALTPRSPLEIPYKRGKQWKLDLNKIREYAVRFQFPPLTGYLRENKLLRKSK